MANPSFLPKPKYLHINMHLLMTRLICISDILCVHLRMSFSYEFDAPQFFDFANVANELNDSDDFFNNYVYKSTAKVKKKLKLGKEDTSKALISTPVNRNCRRIFGGLKKYKSSPHPNGIKRLSTNNVLHSVVLNLKSRSLSKSRGNAAPMASVVKKKKLKLGEEDTSKELVSTPVNRSCRRKFGGLRKYRSTPHPKGIKRLSTNNVPHSVRLNLKSSSLSKKGTAAPLAAVVKLSKNGIDIVDKVVKDSGVGTAHLLKVNKSDGNSKKLINECTSSKGPIDQPQLASKIPRVLKSDKGFKSTVPKPFSFATESRSLARRRFDESISKKRIMNEAKNDRIKELNADKEKQELVQIRKTLVHKPIPVKGIRPFEKRPQLKKPTIPISPKLGLSRKRP